jgi:membrane-anchored protein YejM (alkaline phosphatase superfamily)
MAVPSTGREARSGILWRYAIATWLLLLLNTAGFLGRIDYPGVLTALYTGSIWLTGSLLCLFIGFVPVLLLHRLLPSPSRVPDAVVYGSAVVLFTIVQGFLVMDRYVHGLYGFHLNGFVWNLVTTKGGVSSMGAGSSTTWTFALIGFLILAVQAGLLLALLKVPRLREMGAGKLGRKQVFLVVAALALLLGFDKVTYGVSRFRAYTPVLAASELFPLYVPISFSTILRSWGFKDQPQDLVKMDAGSSRLRYPLAPLEREPRSNPPNIVWLVAESLRADALEPTVMPATWEFAGRALRFSGHYSGGNGTRMGMFSMFYGLYGNAFFPCMTELRSPVLMDALQDAGYQMFIHTSAAFTFPELDKTVFARVPRELLKEGGDGVGWQRDRQHVAEILESIGRRDASKPFFAFMFFESPHAPYTYPDECRVRTPATDEVNYLTMDLQKDILPLKNSYLNACRHLDTQLARLFRGLEESKLLDSTIVLVTGDHGEEFMEKGRWGHHSGYSEEQTRVPLVIHVPGATPRTIDRMTSHLDLPATVLTLLGVKNPPSDYSLGHDLLGTSVRDYTVVSGWAEIAYVDESYKSSFPLKSYDVRNRAVTTRHDAPADAKAFLSARHDRLTQVMKDLKRFQN